MGFFFDDTPFNRGWIDAYNRKPAKDSNPEYLAGYNHGQTGAY